jgi:aminopeptidase-like protein
MGLLTELGQRDAAEIGLELYQFAGELYPICRSITGDGIWRTLALV